MSYIGNSPTSVAFLTDQFSGNGTTTVFTMSVAPATTSSILVAITGVVQDPSTYAVSGTTLTFSAAPPSGTGNISVRYLGIPASGVTTTAYRTVTEFTATAGQTSFSVPSYTVGYISVYRNGVLLGSADYTATNGTTVVLAAGATAGDLVTTESFYVSSVLNALPTSGGTLNGNFNVVGDETVTGNVGIGTSSFSPFKFAVSGYNAAGGHNYIANFTDGVNAGLRIAANSGQSEILSDQAITFWPSSGPERMRIDTNGQNTMTTTIGYAQLRNVNSTAVATGGTVDFPNMSGILIVNNWTQGTVVIFSCGGGLVSTVNTNGLYPGTVAYQSVINGYRWTANSPAGTTHTYSFTLIATRPAA